MTSSARTSPPAVATRPVNVWPTFIGGPSRPTSTTSPFYHQHIVHAALAGKRTVAHQVMQRSMDRDKGSGSRELNHLTLFIAMGMPTGVHPGVCNAGDHVGSFS